MKQLRQLAIATLALFVQSAIAQQSVAQTVPYRAIGTGAYSPLDGDYGGSGVGSPLGKHTCFGNVETTPTADPLVFGLQSTVPQKTIAANGDVIFFNSSGQVQLIPLDKTQTTFSAIWTGQFVVVGGTARFARVKPGPEPLQVVAINLPFTCAESE